MKKISQIAPYPDINLVSDLCEFAVSKTILHKSSLKFRALLKENPKSTEIKLSENEIPAEIMEQLLLFLHEETQTMKISDITQFVKLLYNWQIIDIGTKFSELIFSKITESNILQIANIILENADDSMKIAISQYLEKTQCKDILYKNNTDFKQNLSQKSIQALYGISSKIESENSQFLTMLHELKISLSQNNALEKPDLELRILDLEKKVKESELKLSQAEKRITELEKNYINLQAKFDLLVSSNKKEEQKIPRNQSHILEKNMKTPEIEEQKYSFYYSTSGGNELFLFDLKEKKSRKIIFDLKHAGGASTILVKSDFYLIGGATSNLIIPSTYSIDIESKGPYLAIKKSDMQNPRYRIGLISYQNLFIYAIAGYNNTDAVTLCEKYDIVHNNWLILPALQEKKTFVTVFELMEFVYALGGKSEKIERIDTQNESQGWQVVLFENSDKTWRFRENFTNVKIAENTILIFGAGKKENYVFDCNHTIKNSGSNMLENGGKWWYRYDSAKFGDEICAIDDTCNIHIYNTIKNQWTIIKSAQWKK